MTAILEAQDAPFRLTAPIEHITKLDDGTLLVHCTVTDETPDGQGEVVDYDGFKAAAPDLMKWATLGEMHDPDRMDAGTILRLHFDDASRRAEADLHVVDPVAIRKVLTHTYKAVSIGGTKLAVRPIEVAGRLLRKITRMVVDELSLVNRGANPNALIAKGAFVLAKRATEPDMDAIDAGTASPLDAPPPIRPDGRTPEQAAIDEIRAELAKRDVPQSERDAMAPQDFAGKNDSYPIRQPGDVAAAAKAIGRVGPDNYTSDELKARIIAIARRKGPAFMARLPKAWRKEDKRMAKAAKAAAAAADTTIAKGNDALDAAADAIEAVGEAMAEEAKEQAHGADESADLDTLKTADEALHEFQANESAEPDEPDMEKKAKPSKEDQLAKRLRKMRKANRALRKAKRRLAKRASLSGLTRTLAKAGARNSTKDQDRIEKIHDLTVGLGYGKCMSKTGTPVMPMAKSDTNPIREALEGLVPEDKLAAIEARLSAIDERSRADSETIAKIAAQPTGGGPARGYSPFLRAAEDDSTTATLRKAAALPDLDPRLREGLAQQVALADIRAARGTQG